MVGKASASSAIPPESLAKWPVPLAVAEVYAKAADWQGLRRLAGYSPSVRKRFGNVRQVRASADWVMLQTR